MKRFYLLIGPPQIGKTYAIEKVIDMLKQSGLSVGGMTTDEIREGSVRVGFALKDISTGRSGVLAHINIVNGPRVGKYRVNQADLLHLGAEAILASLRENDVAVIDEIGPMELTSAKFVEAVRAAMVSQKVVLGTIHYRASHPLISQIKQDDRTELFEVSHSNRDRLPGEISKRIANYFGREPKSS